ncbi:MAG: hypothetical protein ACRD11_17290 [Terriglobia bacterium]
MKRIRPRRFLLIGACALLVIVGLMSFGEFARRGHYHLDHARGWDLPATASLDVSHIHLPVLVRPRAAVTFDREGTAVHTFVLPFEAPARESATLRVWFRLRPPPQA